jgi:hypothetical protein
LTDERVLTAGKGIDLTDGGAGSTITVLIDENDIPYTPSDVTDWNSEVDPGDVDDALDQLASNMAPLLPSSAPALDNIDYNTGLGVSGANTWNSTYPISGYTNLPGDGVDTSFTTSGSERGIYDYDTFTSCSGTLNEDVASTDNYPANCFGPGGSDGGATNDLKILVNGVVVHTVDLLTHSGGSDLNVNGSGFSALLDDTPVYFPDSTPFPARTYRTGTWIVVKADLSKGYNEIKVQHVTDAGTQTTNIYELILDDDNTATVFSGESLDISAMSGSKHLSGVEYHTGGVLHYDITISNAYRNTYDDTNAVTFNVSSDLDSLAADDLVASVGDEGKQHVITNKVVNVDSTNRRILAASVTVSTSVNRTVQSDDTSAGDSVSNLLVDNFAANSTDLYENFRDEAYRLKSNSDFGTDLSSNWDETESLVGADAGHNDGAQIFNDILDYPDFDFSAVSNGPAGNPDYSSASGTRYYYRFFTDSTGAANFRISIGGSGTLVTGVPTASTNEFSVRLKWPTETGWLDILTAFIEGNWDDDDGCYYASLGSDSSMPISGRGISIGTKNSANSYDKCYIEVTVPGGWTGYLTDITIEWAAT